MLPSWESTGKYPTGQRELQQEQKPAQISEQNPFIIVMEIAN